MIVIDGVRGVPTAVDDGVDIRGRRVDVAGESSAVHRDVVRRCSGTRSVSTGPGSSCSSGTGLSRRLSPVSTAAKTMDENLNFLMVNTQSNSPVDNVDNPSGTIHALEGIDGGRR